MSLKPDKSDFLAHCARSSLSASLGALAIVLLGACSTRTAPPGGPQAPTQNDTLPHTSPAALPGSTPGLPPGSAPNLTSVATPGLAPDSATAARSNVHTNTNTNTNANANASPAAPLASAPVFLPPADTVLRLLAYADRVRNLSTAEVAQEIARLGNPSAPAGQVQLALLLSQLHQTQDLIRAQELLTRVINSPAPEAQLLQPLARLLAARYGEQRRLEDQIDRQAQQLREVQRRLDQTHERLEALKAIERSLTSRPPAPAASSPASRPRRTAPPAP